MTLYEVIAQMRREHPTPSASRALDMVSAELGRTHENLRKAISNLEQRPLPANGQQVLDDLLARAEREDVADIDMGPAPGDRPPSEPLDEGTLGVGLLMGGTALVAMLLLLAALGAGLNKIYHFI
jgi:hypothetical protein